MLKILPLGPTDASVMTPIFHCRCLRIRTTIQPILFPNTVRSKAVKRRRRYRGTATYVAALDAALKKLKNSSNQVEATCTIVSPVTGVGYNALTQTSKIPKIVKVLKMGLEGRSIPDLRGRRP